MAWVIATHFVSIYNFPIICNHKYKHTCTHVMYIHIHLSSHLFSSTQKHTFISYLLYTVNKLIK